MFRFLVKKNKYTVGRVLLNESITTITGYVFQKDNSYEYALNSKAIVIFSDDYENYTAIKTENLENLVAYIKDFK